MDVLSYMILSVLFILVVFFLRPRRKMKGKIIPGPTGIPLAGCGFEITEQNMPHVCYNYSEQYGDIVQIKMFGTNVILINTTALLQTAFSGDGYKQLLNDRPAYFYTDRFLFESQGVISYKNGFSNIHGNLRKFFIKGLHAYGEGTKVFEEKVVTALKMFTKRLESFGNNEVELVDELQRTFSNLLSILLIGESLDNDDPEVNLFWEFNQSLMFMYSPKADVVYSKFPFARYIPGTYRNQYQRMEVCTQRILERYFFRTKATHKPDVERGLIDFFLEEQAVELQNGKKDIVLTEDRIKALVLECVPAAMLSTLCAMSGLMLCLLNREDCQKKAQAEIDHVIGRNRWPTLADRPNCPYLEAVALEAQRLVTVIPMAGPHFCRQHVSFEGYDIPADSLLLPNLYYVHHDKKIWGEDVWDFRPERFLDEDGQLLPRSHLFRKNWIPFSTGRRQCLGETFARNRIFLYTATLLQRWTFKSVPGKTCPCDPRTDFFENNLVLRPKKVYCRLEER